MQVFEEFRNEVRENILNYMGSEYAGCTADIIEKEKNNGLVMYGLTIHDEKNPSTITPIIYLNNYYERHAQGESMDSVLKSLASDYTSVTRDDHSIEEEMVKDLLQYENAKERIRPRLINRAMNTSKLEGVAHTNYIDLAVTYHIEISHDQEGIASVPITNELLDRFGISVEELHEQAVENINLDKPRIDSMMNVLMGLFSDAPELAKDVINEEAPPMLVITNESGVFGSAVILDEDILGQVSEKIGGVFYLLPSSVHEVIAIPADTDFFPDKLNEMIQQINEDVVKSDEVLSDHAYIYDSKTHELLPAYGQNYDKDHSQTEEQSHEKEMPLSQTGAGSHEKSPSQSQNSDKTYDNLPLVTPELAVGEPIQPLEHSRRQLIHGR